MPLWSPSFELFSAAVFLAADAPAPGVLTPSILGDILGAVSGLAAIVVTILGIRRWRGQMKGTVEYRAALDVLRKVDAVREAMLAARHRPLAREEESLAAQGGEGAVLANEEDEYEVNLGKVAEARDALLSAQQRAFAIWGEPAKDALRDMLLTVDSLFDAREQYFGEERARAESAVRGRDAGPEDAGTLAMGRVLYATPSAQGKDPFRERIARAAARAEAFFRGRLP